MPDYNGGDTAKSNKPILQAMFERMEKLNSEQTITISSIEDKIHAINNRRVPDKKEAELRNAGEPRDAVSALGQEVERIRNANDRLSQILGYLQDIV